MHMEKEALNISNELLEFIGKCPDSYFAVKEIRERLLAAGFAEVGEGDPFDAAPGSRLFMTRGGSSLIAFEILEDPQEAGFDIFASHLDSPMFKVKRACEEKSAGYIRLNTEKYGGMILSSWLDRPLSVSGRIVVRTEDGINVKLVNLDRDLLIIPSLAIHMSRDSQQEELNPQKDLLPLFTQIPEKVTGDEGGKQQELLYELIAEEAGVRAEDILDADLFVYNRMKGTTLGLDNEFVASPRLDDLQCTYAGLCGFLETENPKAIPVLAIFDNEEVGSGTKQGAGSTFLADTLNRINDTLGGDRATYLRRLRRSFVISADNAHSVHPAHTEKADPTNRPLMNRGIVIKYNAAQKYTTDAVSGGIFRVLADKAGVPVQTFANRSDMRGGSTLGNILDCTVPVHTVDIGLAQLAMHSAYETAGVLDTWYLKQIARLFFESRIIPDGPEYRIETADLPR